MALAACYAARGIPSGLPLGFAGGHSDPDTGLVRFVARDYDPEIGRWTAGDPIGVQGGLNAYLYVGNNPVNATDPYGLAPNWLDRIHDGLGVLGLAPGIGIFADIGALGISIARLDGAGALIDAGSMLPLAGGAVRGGELAYKAGKAVLKNADNVADAVKIADNVADAVKIADDAAEVGRFADDVPDVIHVTPQGVALPAGEKYKIPEHYVEQSDNNLRAVVSI